MRFCQVAGEVEGAGLGARRGEHTLAVVIMTEQTASLSFNFLVCRTRGGLDQTGSVGTGGPAPAENQAK